MIIDTIEWTNSLVWVRVAPEAGETITEDDAIAFAQDHEGASANHADPSGDAFDVQFDRH